MLFYMLCYMQGDFPACIETALVLQVDPLYTEIQNHSRLVGQ